MKTSDIVPFGWNSQNIYDKRERQRDRVVGREREREGNKVRKMRHGRKTVITASEMSFTPAGGITPRRTSQPANRMTMPIWATASKTVTKLLSKVSMLGIPRIGWGASQDFASAGLFSAGRVVSF